MCRPTRTRRAFAPGGQLNDDCRSNLVRRLRRFTAAARHELKRPLTSCARTSSAPCTPWSSPSMQALESDAGDPRCRIGGQLLTLAPPTGTSTCTATLRRGPSSQSSRRRLILGKTRTEAVDAPREMRSCRRQHEAAKLFSPHHETRSYTRVAAVDYDVRLRNNKRSLGVRDKASVLPRRPDTRLTGSGARIGCALGARWRWQERHRTRRFGLDSRSRNGYRAAHGGSLSAHRWVAGAFNVLIPSRPQTQYRRG